MGQRGSKISRDQLTKYLQKRGSNVLYVAHQNRDVKVIRLMFMGTMAATLFLTWNVKVRFLLFRPLKMERNFVLGCVLIFLFVFHAK